MMKTKNTKKPGTVQTDPRAFYLPFILTKWRCVRKLSRTRKKWIVGHFGRVKRGVLMCVDARKAHNRLYNLYYTILTYTVLTKRQPDGNQTATKDRKPGADDPLSSLRVLDQITTRGRSDRVRFCTQFQKKYNMLYPTPKNSRKNIDRKTAPVL